VTELIIASQLWQVNSWNTATRPEIPEI
jgi:hypothetical protein